MMAQNATANVQHHRPVTMNEDGEGVFLAAAREGKQQLLIAFVLAALHGQRSAKVAKPSGQNGIAHDGVSGIGTCYPLLYSSRPTRFRRRIFAAVALSCFLERRIVAHKTHLLGREGRMSFSSHRCLRLCIRAAKPAFVRNFFRVVGVIVRRNGGVALYRVAKPLRLLHWFDEDVAQVECLACLDLELPGARATIQGNTPAANAEREFLAGHHAFQMESPFLIGARG